MRQEVGGQAASPYPFLSFCRNRFRAAVTFSMFFHLEHHLFPQVPTARLHILARRIDAADPRYINNPLGQFNPSAFIANFLWNSHYRTVRSANELVSALAGSGEQLSILRLSSVCLHDLKNTSTPQRIS